MVDGPDPVTRPTVDTSWEAVGVPVQAGEDRDTREVADGKWRRIYVLFGANTEALYREVKLAWWVYCAKNGSSPEGKYSKPVRTASSTRAVTAGEIVAITGRTEGEVREFNRSYLEDSYRALKSNQEWRKDPELVAKAQAKSLPIEAMHLLADWFGKSCPYFTPQEAKLYVQVSGVTIADARARRAEKVEPVTEATADITGTAQSNW